jgi:hypothetical protein
MLFYECRHWSQPEVDDERYIDRKASLPVHPDQVGSLTRHDLWEDIVQGFSGRHFTYPTDKFPATSSIARYFSGVSKDTIMQDTRCQSGPRQF